MKDASILDLMVAYCILHRASDYPVTSKPFQEVVADMTDAGTKLPNVVELSKAVREHLGFCHFSCHYNEVTRQMQLAAERIETPDNVVSLFPGQPIYH